MSAKMLGSDTSDGRPRVLVSLPYGMSARNVLRSEIYPRLREAAEVAIVCPLSADPEFRREFSGPGVSVYDLPRRFSLPYKVLRAALDYFEGYYFTHAHQIITLEMLRRSLQRNHPIRYWAGVLAGLLGGNSLALPRLRALQEVWGRNRYFSDLFDAFQPDLVFCTHPLALEEYPIAFEARHRRARLVTMIHSWDNLSAKSGMRTVVGLRPGRMLPTRFDKVIVWNEIQAQELGDFYGYQREDVFVAGIPQFDIYARHDYPPREEFMRRIGADPAKRLVLFAAGSPSFVPQQVDVVKLLVQAIEDERIGAPVQLLIRCHPGDDVSTWQARFAGASDVLFQQPGPANLAGRISEGWDRDAAEEALLAETMYHSDVVVQVGSTIAVDATALDRPCIGIGFDGYRPRPYDDAIARLYDQTHYLPVVESGGLRIARSHEGLIDQINQYLENPTLDAKGRQLIRERLCYRVDGDSGRRIGDYLARLITS